MQKQEQRNAAATDLLMNTKGETDLHVNIRSKCGKKYIASVRTVVKYASPPDLSSALKWQTQHLSPGCRWNRPANWAVIANKLTMSSSLASEKYSHKTTDLQFATLTATWDTPCQGTFIRHKIVSRFFQLGSDFRARIQLTRNSVLNVCHPTFSRS